MPGTLAGELRSLKRPRFLKLYAVSLELLKDTAADVLKTPPIATISAIGRNQAARCSSCWAIKPRSDSTLMMACLATSEIEMQSALAARAMAA